jgi:hypothetical protein
MQKHRLKAKEIVAFLCNNMVLDMPQFSLILNDVMSHYKKIFREYGHSAQGANWRDKDGQFLRFKVILDIIKRKNIENKTLADMGCGSGSFLDFCLKEKIKLKSYIGYDILNEPIENIKKNTAFDYFEKELIVSAVPIKNSDYFIASGLFNVKLESCDDVWKRYIFSLLDAMYEKSNIGVCFNLFTDVVDWRCDDLFYGSSEEFKAHFQKYSPKNIIVSQNYGLFEWTMYIEK